MKLGLQVNINYSPRFVVIPLIPLELAYFYGTLLTVNWIGKEIPMQVPDNGDIPKDSSAISIRVSSLFTHV